MSTKYFRIGCVAATALMVATGYKLYSKSTGQQPYVVTAGYIYNRLTRRQQYIVDPERETYKPVRNLSPNDNEYGISYARFPDEVIEYIKSVNKSVLEVCAGNGSMAEALREHNIVVDAFDVFSNKFVKYGPVGSVEHLYPDSILLVLNGINVKRSIEAFQGDIIILGGHGDWCNVKRKTIEVIHDPEKPVVTTLESYGVSLWGESPSISVEIRPKSNYMIESGYSLDKVFFAKINNDSDWNRTFYVFQVWVKNLSSLNDT